MNLSHAPNLGDSNGDLPSIQEIEAAQRNAQKHVFELETSKIETAGRGSDTGAIEVELEAAREVLRQAKFQRFVVLGEIGAKFPSARALEALQSQRETNRYWMEANKPGNLPATYERGVPPVFRRHIEHSVTTDYESDKWAVINILLETLQNAEPFDSNGTWFGIEVCVRGKWRVWNSLTSKELKKLKDEDVEAVRITDNGGGYAPTELKIFGSSKGANSDAGGRFGEGGNMADITACRLGIDVTKASRNWRAKPHAFEQRATGRTVLQLGYDTEFYDDIVPGTQVEFRGFGPDFVQAIRGIKDHYLPLRGAEFTVVSNTQYGDIVEQKDTDTIFVKGRAYPLSPSPDQPFLFAYNLTRFVVQDRNRSRINLYDALPDIKMIWNGNRSRQAVKDLITAHKSGKSCYELVTFGKHINDCWDQETIDLFGEVACEVYGIPDPDKTFSTMGEGYDEAEKFLREIGGLSALNIGGSKFLTQILQKRFASVRTIFNGPEVPGALACTSKGDILEKGSEIFVDAQVAKINHAVKHPLLFSYNLKRGVSSGYCIDFGVIEERIIAIWREVKNEQVVRELFDQYNAGQKSYELSQCASGWVSLYPNYPSAELFRKVAYETFDVKDPAKCFLQSADSAHRDSEMALKEKGYTCIDLHESPMLRNFLSKAGILTAEEVLEKGTAWKEMDVPMKVAAKPVALKNVLVGLWRFMGTCEVEVLVQKIGKDDKKTETWMPYKQWLAGAEGQTIAYRFIGKNAQITQDDLDYEERSQKEPPCLHSLCSFLRINNVPFTIKSGRLLIRIEERDYGKFAYKIQDLGENGSDGSAVVTIFEPNEDFLAALRSMKDQVLDLDPAYEPLEKTPFGDLVKTDGGRIFRHGIIEESEEEAESQLLASYYVSSNDEAAPSHILENLSNVNVIQKILRGAVDGKDYADIDGMTCLENPDAWRDAFVAEFGKKVVVADGQSMLAAAVLNRFGYQQVSFSEVLTKILVHEAKVPSLGGLAGVGAYKEKKNLSENVVTLLAFGANIRAWLKERLEMAGADIGNNLVEWDPANIVIVQRLKNKNGDDLHEFGGFFDPESGKIFIFADRLVELSKSLQAMMRVMNYSLGNVFKDHVQASLYMDNVFSALMDCLVRSECVRDLLGASIDALDPADLEQGLANLFGAMTQEAKREKAKREAALHKRAMKQLRLLRRILAKWSEKQIKQAQKGLLDLKQNIVDWPAEQMRKFRSLLEFGSRGEDMALESVVQPQLGSVPVIQRTLRTAILLLMVGGTGLLLAGRVNMQALFNEINLGGMSTILDAMPKIDLSGIIPEIRLADLFSGGDLVYSRPLYPGGYSPSITAKSAAQGVTEEMDDPTWMETVFLSVPNYNQWDGFWMSDYGYHQFDGTNWNHDTDAPKFPYQNYPDQLTWMHLQSITSPGKTFIRTASAGVIDPASIQVLDENKNLLPYSAVPQEDGMFVTVEARGAKKIVYTTKMPVNFERTAVEITDADYKALPDDAYQYYTSTPNIDLSAVPFSWKHAPNARTWKDFFDELHQLRPYERFKRLYNYVSSREYSDTPETGKAYAKFAAGLLPQKTLIEFLLSSPKLPSIGAGDCDVHNTLYAWALRKAGIPAKLDIVMNGEHGIVNAFFPGIGWVVGDAVGQRMEQQNHGREFRPQEVDVLSAAELQRYNKELFDRQRRNEAINQCIRDIDQ